MTATPITNREFLQAIPKTDLHVHLDGSLRLGTLIELARDQKIALPSTTEEGLLETVFKERYEDLVDYLRGFSYTCAVMQTPEAIERVAYEFALDCFAEGIRYVEPRFAPQLHINPALSMEEVLACVHRGLDRGKREINARPEIAKGEDPPFDYGIIGCALRMFTGQFSGYYRRLTELHPHMPKDDLQGLASLDLVRELIYARDERGIPIVAFDLAGAEKGYPAEDHKRAYELAHKNFLKKTVHAGEAFGPESIFQAITDCHADRIGHGTHLFDTDAVSEGTPQEREAYVRALWEYIADRRITIEVCLTSNLQTMPNLTNIADHPFVQMLDKRLSITFCTDNRLVSRTTVTDEIALALSAIDVDPRKLKDLIIYGFKRSFYPGNYIEKRHYVRDIIDYYERMERKFGVESKKKQ